jgi:hypothetical protein
MFTDVSKEPAASIFRTTFPPQKRRQKFLLHIDKHIQGITTQNTEISGKKTSFRRGNMNHGLEKPGL